MTDPRTLNNLFLYLLRPCHLKLSWCILSLQEIDRGNPPDAFVVLYSVVDKASFLKAETELNRLQDADLLRCRPAILVANKIDLARSRAVSTQGRLTFIYKILEKNILQLKRILLLIFDFHWVTFQLKLYGNVLNTTMKSCEKSYEAD